LQIAKHS